MTRQEILPPAEKPRRYRAPGDGALRDAMLAVADHFKGRRREQVALAMCLDMLDTLGRNALTPAQRKLCAAYVDAFSDVVPSDIRELFASARQKKDRA